MILCMSWISLIYLRARIDDDRETGPFFGSKCSCCSCSKINNIEHNSADSLRAPRWEGTRLEGQMHLHRPPGLTVVPQLLDINSTGSGGIN